MKSLKLLLVADNPADADLFSALLEQNINGWQHFFADTLVDMEMLLKFNFFDMVVLSGRIANNTSQDYINKLIGKHPSTAVLVSCKRRNELNFGNKNQEMFIKLFIKIIGRLEDLQPCIINTKPIIKITKKIWNSSLKWSDN